MSVVAPRVVTLRCASFIQVRTMFHFIPPKVTQPFGYTRANQVGASSVSEPWGELTVDEGTMEEAMAEEAADDEPTVVGVPIRRGDFPSAVAPPSCSK
mmetsp:Transcript_76198/g.151079  ORF Transcript_76198/g.151079 Transcript_76198/m.151079 type:complete len:98 (+) Transcript_76198:484-777(+)